MMSQAVTWLFLSAHFLSPYDFTDRFNVLDYKIDDAAYCSNNNNEIHHGLHLPSKRGFTRKNQTDTAFAQVILRFWRCGVKNPYD